MVVPALTALCYEHIGFYTVCDEFINRSGAPAAQRGAKRSFILIKEKKKKPMNEFSHGYHSQRYCSWARTHDDGDGDGGRVAQDGGHTPNNRLTDTRSLGLSCTSLILDIHVMTNYTDTNQNKVSADQYHITGSSL